MKKKYRLTDETIEFNGVKLYRIEALRDFGDVKKGDKGGFVQSEKNLSQFGNCWIYGDAKVFNYAYVSCDAICECSSLIYGHARVADNARIFHNSKVHGYSCILENAYISNYSNVYGTACIRGNAFIRNNSTIHDDVEVYGNAIISGTSIVRGDSKVFGEAEICDALIERSSDYIVFKNWWSSLRYFTWTRSNNMWKVGCFYGTGEELIEKAYKDSELSGREYKRVVEYVESILRDENQNKVIINL